MSFKQEWDRVSNNDLKRTEILESNGSACNNVLVTAIHNKTQWRDNKMKWAEPQTEELVKLLNIKNDTWGLYKTSSDYEDANVDDLCNTRNVLFNFLKNHKEIKLIISLHQLRKDRASGVDLNTAKTNSQEIIEIFKDEINKQSITYSENKYYDGDTPFSCWLKDCFPDVEFIQVEMNSKMFIDDNFEINYRDCERIFLALSNSIKKISETYKKGRLYS